MPSKRGCAMSDDETISFRAPKGWREQLLDIARHTPGSPTPSVVIRQALEAKHPALRKNTKVEKAVKS